jgi:hypothetical protein
VSEAEKTRRKYTVDAIKLPMADWVSTEAGLNDLDWKVLPGDLNASKARVKFRGVMAGLVEENVTMR